MEALVGDPKRLTLIVADPFDHFEERIEALGYDRLQAHRRVRCARLRQRKPSKPSSAKPNFFAPTGSSTPPRYTARRGNRSIALPFAFRATSDSCALCKFIQKSADMPKYWASRNAVVSGNVPFPRQR